MTTFNPIIGNVGPLNPIPNFDHASTGVAIAWGLCLSGASVFFYFFVFAPKTTDRRRNCFLAIAIALLFVSCGVSVRDHSHELRENLARMKQKQEIEREETLKNQNPSEQDDKPGHDLK